MERGRRKERPTGSGSGGGGGSSSGGGTRRETAILYKVPPPLDRPAPNYTVVDLEGTRIQVRNRWRKSVLDYRLWCFNTSDKRFEFGHPFRRCCVLPSCGHFLVYMHYKGKWLCAVIDGASGYLDGYITRSVGGANDVRIRENKDPNLTNPAFIEHAKELPWDGAYITGYRTKCGDMPLVKSFLALHQYVDGQEHVPSEKDVINAGQTFILYFPEAAKFDSLYLDNIHRNFRAGHSIGKPAIKKAKSWKTQCGIVHSNVQEDGERVTQATAELESTKQILEDIRLIHRKPITHGYFLVKDMPMHLSINGPIDVAWAEKELRRSHELGLDDPTWGFLTERFPKFPC